METYTEIVNKKDKRYIIEALVALSTLDQKLVARNIAVLVNAYIDRGVPVADLIQSALLGVMRAQKLYLTDTKASFSTYAYYWTRKFVQEYVNTEGRDIRLPKWFHEDRIVPLERAIRDWSSYEHPTDEELAETMSWSIAKVQETLAWSRYVPVNIDDDLLDVGDPEASADGGMAHEELSEHIDDILEGLTHRHREIIELRFGLSDGRMWSLAEVADELNISKQAAQKAEKIAINLLRQDPKTKKLIDF